MSLLTPFYVITYTILCHQTRNSLLAIMIVSASVVFVCDPEADTLSGSLHENRRRFGLSATCVVRSGINTGGSVY